MVYSDTETKAPCKSVESSKITNVLDMRLYCRRMETQMMKAVAELPPSAYADIRPSPSNKWPPTYASQAREVENPSYSRLYQLDAVTKPIQRRTKRMVPCELKDERYWEKRKRNNDAARRSRENKRQLELDIRSRVVILEEENSLLRKENAILKGKFGLSPDIRYLSVDESGDLLPSGAMPPQQPPIDFSRCSISSESDTNSSFPTESSTPSSSISTSSADTGYCDNSHDEFVPMKKRKRPKHEASLADSSSSASGGSSSSNNSSPTSSLNTYPPYPATQPAFQPPVRTQYDSYPSNLDQANSDPNNRESAPRSSSSSMPAFPVYPTSLPTMSAFSQAAGSKDYMSHYYSADVRSSSDVSMPHHSNNIRRSVDSDRGADRSLSGEPSLTSCETSSNLPASPYTRSGSCSDMRSTPDSEAHVKAEVQNNVPANSQGSHPADNNGNKLVSPTENLSLHSDEDVRRENELIKSQLMQLSEEVARMRDFVLQSNKPASAAE